MVVGVREKSKMQVIQEHLAETIENINGWNNEKDFAIKHEDKGHEQFCYNMIRIWENTKNQLQQELEMHR